MRKFLLILLLSSFSISAFSQNDPQLPKDSLEQVSTKNDSAGKKLQQVADSSAKSIEIRQWEDGNIKAMLQIAEQAEKNRAREKRNAFLRIGIGMAFLLVLVVGLMRKKAKK